MKVCAVVPVKTLTEAKSRLVHVLSAERRRALVLDMLQHVLIVVGASRVDRVLVVTRDRHVASLARAAGAACVSDPADTLNKSLAEVFCACWAKNETPLYLPADLPRLETSDLNALLDAAVSEPAIVLAPARDEEGTNALLVPGATAMEPRLGGRSFARHCAEAERLGVRTLVYRSPGLGLDVDTEDDLLLVSSGATPSPEVHAR